MTTKCCRIIISIYIYVCTYATYPYQISTFDQVYPQSYSYTYTMSSSSRSVTILYGSETGNAQDFSYILARRCKYLRFDPVVSSLDDYDLKKLLDVKLLVVICSTTGQGDLPRNAKKFWKFMMKKKLPSDLFGHLKFTTFGLGDSSYPKFNFAIKKIHARFLQLGASEFCGRAESDEMSPEGTEAFYGAWEKEFIDTLGKSVPLPDGLLEIDTDTLLPPSNELTLSKSTFKRSTDDSKEVSLSRQNKALITVEVMKNSRITKEDHFQDVRHLVLKDPSGSLNYQPGDTVALYPSNSPSDVQALLDCQGWQDIADLSITIEEPIPNVDGGFVKPLTLRSLFTHHLDIMSIPRRSFFMLAWHFSDDEREQEKLKEFSTIEESEQLYDYANRPRRSILEVIQEFFSLKIPYKYIFDIFPLLKPRLFSIASKPDPFTVELAIAIVEYRTILKRIRRGVCTSWIKTLREGDTTCISLHEGGLNFDGNSPILLVAPGTGIAPMKSLVEKYENSGRQIVLFFGCRYKEKDFLFGDYWSQLDRQGKIQLFPCFSRDEENKENGKYVQDGLYIHKKLVNDLIVNQKAMVYLCGASGKMPTQVRITLETIFTEMNEWSEEQSTKHLLNMENTKKYIQETW